MAQSQRINRILETGEYIMKITQEMVDYCRSVGNGKKEIKGEYGFCRYFYDVFDISLTFLIEFSLYPSFSGYKAYPVPHPMGAKEAYEQLVLRQDAAWMGKYGDERRKFCRWCADELERKMREQ